MIGASTGTGMVKVVGCGLDSGYLLKMEPKESLDRLDGEHKRNRCEE